MPPPVSWHTDQVPAETVVIGEIIRISMCAGYFFLFQRNIEKEDECRLS